MARRNEGFFEMLVHCPWWVSFIVAAGAYIGLRSVAPALDLGNPALNAVASKAPKIAWVSVFFLLPAIPSAFESFRKRRMLDRQSGIESIRELTWKQFEELIGEAYRRQGYRVMENHTAGPDGGVDLRLQKGGTCILVQAKQWKSGKVGVKIVREMYGVMTAEGADGVIIVCSGMFTQEAMGFAAGKPIDLVGGNELLELVRGVQASAAANTAPIAQGQSIQAQKGCPKCGKEPVIRVAQKGPQAASEFWGCSGYSGCRHTQHV